MSEIEQKWFKPSAIAEKGLILDSNGKASYRHVVRLIKSGKLQARVWAKQGDKSYYTVHIDEINRYNTESLFVPEVA